MKKIILTMVTLISLFILTGCSKADKKTSDDEGEVSISNNENKEVVESNVGKEIYVSNYAAEKVVSEIVVLDENLEFIKKLSPEGGLRLTTIPERNEVYSYGAESLIRIKTIDKSMTNLDVTPTTIRWVTYINENVWAIDNGYFAGENSYEFNIINLDTESKNTYEGYPLSYTEKDNSIYIIIDNIKELTVDLLKFNTVDGTSELIKLKDIESETTNVEFKIVALENSLMIIDVMNFNIAKIKYDNLNEWIDSGNVSDYGIDSLPRDAGPTQVYNFAEKLDDDNILIGLSNGVDAKLVKINIHTEELTEILKGIGDGYRYLAKPVVDGEYIYLSFVKPDEVNTISKYNWKTNELIKQATLETYFDKHKQIGNLTMYKGQE